MRKQFRIHGVPWIYDLKQEKMNPRDKKPKTAKRVIERAERHLKIQKNLAEADEKIMEFRQQKLNKRPLGGLDRVIMKALPSWVKNENSDIPDYLKKKKNKSE